MRPTPARAVHPKSHLYGAENTWVTILAAIVMGLAGVCFFIFAVKSNHFKDFEDAKYQVFWNDAGELIESSVAQPDASEGQQEKAEQQEKTNDAETPRQPRNPAQPA